MRGCVPFHDFILDAVYTKEMKLCTLNRMSFFVLDLVTYSTPDFFHFRERAMKRNRGYLLGIFIIDVVYTKYVNELTLNRMSFFGVRDDSEVRIGDENDDPEKNSLEGTNGIWRKDLSVRSSS